MVIWGALSGPQMDLWWALKVNGLAWAMLEMTNTRFVQSLSKSKLCPISIQEATSGQCVGDGQVDKSSVCPEFVQIQTLSNLYPESHEQSMCGRRTSWQVQCLSKVCPSPTFVQTLSRHATSGQWAGDGRVDKSRVCPEFVQVPSLSRIYPKSEKSFLKCSIGRCRDKDWISKSTVCPMTSGLDRISMNSGQRPDRPCTLHVIGQAFDRVMTEFGQRLDFMSKLCPTTFR